MVWDVMVSLGQRELTIHIANQMCKPFKLKKLTDHSQIGLFVPQKRQ